MSNVAIRAENLSKLYHIEPRERYKTLRDTLTDVMYAPFRAARTVLYGRRSSVPGRPSSVVSPSSVVRPRKVLYMIRQMETVEELRVQSPRSETVSWAAQN
jgi:hypothetical protein